MSRAEADSPPKRWRFSPAPRREIAAALKGFENPERVAHMLEHVAAAYPVRRASAKHWKAILDRGDKRRQRIGATAERLRVDLETLSLLDGYELLEALERAWGGRPDRALARFCRSLAQVRDAARAHAPHRGGRPPDNLRTNICTMVAGILATAPASPGRLSRERRGDAGDWRAEALDRVLPVVLAAVGGRPHNRDYPPLLARARAALVAATPAASPRPR